MHSFHSGTKFWQQLLLGSSTAYFKQRVKLLLLYVIILCTIPLGIKFVWTRSFKWKYRKEASCCHNIIIIEVTKSQIQDASLCSQTLSFFRGLATPRPSYYWIITHTLGRYPLADLSTRLQWDRVTRDHQFPQRVWIVLKVCTMCNTDTVFKG